MTTLGRALCLLLLFAGCDQGPSMKTEPVAVATPVQVGSAAPATATPAVKVDGQQFGEGITLADTSKIDDILAQPKTFIGKTVRVEGMITDVCEMRGCWMELAGSQPGTKLKFKVADGVMTFPVDAKGKHAVAQGVVAVRDMTLDETKEYAEYTAKEQGKPFDPASVTAPLTIVRLDGTGAVLQ